MFAWGMLWIASVLVGTWADFVDEDVLVLNRLRAQLAWNASVGEPLDPRRLSLVDELVEEWHAAFCDHASTFDVQPQRKSYLLCRGVFFDRRETSALNSILNDMQSLYADTRICIPSSESVPQKNFQDQILAYLWKVQNRLGNEKKLSQKAIRKAAADVAYGNIENPTNQVCMSGEPDLERLMTSSRNKAVLEWSWLAWRRAVGPPMKEPYARMVSLENNAAKRKGFSDIGQVWRAELEIDGLQSLVEQLLGDVRELYELLHGVVRHFLAKHYGSDGDSLIDAHLLGDMWAQNWAAILDLVMPVPDTMHLDKLIKKTNWTVVDMVIRAEDLYTSMGMPKMTDKFWQHSRFGGDDGGKVRCHGTAADMFADDDYRMIHCGALSMDDLYVVHHEMGHVQYYMSYGANVSAVFRDSANSAFGESVGDAVMLAATSPQHLHRLGVIGDGALFERAFDDALLLRQALNKLPQVPFGYVVDKYRWAIFAGDVAVDEYNSAFWRLTARHQGVRPPGGVERDERYFDAAAKFHLSDNTPYVRYFLSSFMQMQVFRGLCRWSVFGKIDFERKLPMPLHRCDLYGAKLAGRKLRDAMSKGSSIKWSDALFTVSGEREISSDAFLEYFEPLKALLNRMKHENNITIGYDA